MQPFKPSYFKPLAEGFLKSTQGQHYALTFTAEELVVLHNINQCHKEISQIETEIEKRFDTGWKEGPHGTFPYIVAGAMFSAWINEMLSWEARADG